MFGLPIPHGSPDPPLLQYADLIPHMKAAIAFVQAHIPSRFSATHQDAISSQVGLYSRRSVMIATREMRKEQRRFLNSLPEETERGEHFGWIVSHYFMNKFCVGNCEENGDLGLLYFMQKYPDYPVEKCCIKKKGGQDSHVVLVLNRIKGSDPNNPKKWGNESAILDVQHGRYFRSNRIPKDWKIYLNCALHFKKWEKLGYCWYYENIFEDFSKGYKCCITKESVKWFWGQYNKKLLLRYIKKGHVLDGCLLQHLRSDVTRYIHTKKQTPRDLRHLLQAIDLTLRQAQNISCYQLLHDWAGRNVVIASEDTKKFVRKLLCKYPKYLYWQSFIVSPVKWSVKGYLKENVCTIL